MFCEKCGRELEENAKFCDKCGAPVNQDTPLPSSEIDVTAGKSYRVVLMIAAVVVGGLAGVLIVPYLIGVLHTQNNNLKTDADISIKETSDSQYQNKQTETVSKANKQAKLQKKKQSESSSKNTESTTHRSDMIEGCYLADFLGKSIGEIIDTLGDPYKTQRGYLGGSGNDNGYMYEKGNIVFITLFASEYDYYFDERDAKVNYI